MSLEIRDEHREGVLRYLALAASYAELVEGLPLDARDEPGSVFLPVLPPEDA